MPRYFFHVQDGDSIPDSEGLDLPGPKETRHQAIAVAGELIRNKSALDGSEWRMSVMDENGRPVLTIRFAAEDHGTAL